MNMAQFLSITTIACMCGLTWLAGIALALIHKILVFNSNNRISEMLWTAGLCLGMVIATLGPLFSFIILVVDESRGGSFLIRLLIFCISAIIGLSFSLYFGHIINLSVKNGKIDLLKD